MEKAKLFCLVVKLFKLEQKVLTYHVLHCLVCVVIETYDRSACLTSFCSHVG